MAWKRIGSYGRMRSWRFVSCVQFWRIYGDQDSCNIDWSNILSTKLWLTGNSCCPFAHSEPKRRFRIYPIPTATVVGRWVLELDKEQVRVWWYRGMSRYIMSSLVWSFVDQFWIPWTSIILMRSYSALCQHLLSKSLCWSIFTFKLPMRNKNDTNKGNTLVRESDNISLVSYLLYFSVNLP
jgi:hypothetical protein